MSEFLREVDDDYRRDRVVAFWARHGITIAVLGVLVLGGFGIWRYMGYVEHQKVLASTQKMEEAFALSRDAKPEEAVAALAALEASAQGPVKGLALLRRAGELAKVNPEEAARVFDEVSREASLSLTLKQLAQLRASALRLDGEAAPDALKTLESLATPTNPWRHQARELLGVTALKKGDRQEAARWFDAITLDRQTPPSLTGRLEVYVALVASKTDQK
jgi:hypothetical protein